MSRIPYRGPVDLQPIYEWDSLGNPLYAGLSLPGAQTSARAWQIKKFTFDASGNFLYYKYAGSNSSFTNIWDDRAILIYS